MDISPVWATLAITTPSLTCQCPVFVRVCTLAGDGASVRLDQECYAYSDHSQAKTSHVCCRCVLTPRACGGHTHFLVSLQGSETVPSLQDDPTLLYVKENLFIK